MTLIGFPLLSELNGLTVTSAAAANVTEPALIDVGGRRLALTCSGHGSPTVILEAGLTTGQISWYRVSPGIATFTRVCAYDRAGVGQSDPAPTPRTAQDIVDDLDALLTAANISGPVVFVGASFGGLVVRLFASQHPERTAGLVLVDASHEDQSERFRAVLTPEQQQSLGLDNDRNSEGIDFAASNDEVAASGPLPDVPLVVLTAGRPKPVPPGYPGKKLDRVWRDLQADLATLTSNSVRMVAGGSEHDIAIEQPDAVVAAVRLAVNSARTGAPLPQPETATPVTSSYQQV